MTVIRFLSFSLHHLNGQMYVSLNDYPSRDLSCDLFLVEEPSPPPSTESKGTGLSAASTNNNNEEEKDDLIDPLIQKGGRFADGLNPRTAASMESIR